MLYRSVSSENERTSRWRESFFRFVCLVGCLTSQQHASVSQGRICSSSDKFRPCHTEIQVADQTLYLTQSQYTNTGPTSPSTDSATPGAWQGSHRSTNFQVAGMTRPRKIPAEQAGIEPVSPTLKADTLTTRPRDCGRETVSTWIQFEFRSEFTHIIT